MTSCKSSHPITSGKSKLKLSERLERLKLSDLSGKAIRLNDYSGKPIFLNFWATWCGPCKSEMATIEEVSHQYKDDIIFLLASDEDPSLIQHYISEHTFDLHFIHLDNTYLDAYIIELPTTFLIDRNGQLVTEEEGFRIWTDPGNVDSLRKLIETGGKNEK